MKTGEYTLGPDEVLETLPDGRVRVRRQVPFLVPLPLQQGAFRASTVAVPSNHTPIAALKSEGEEEQVSEEHAPETVDTPAPEPAPAATQAEKAGLWDRFVSLFRSAGAAPEVAVKELAPVIAPPTPPAPSLVENFALQVWRERWWTLRDVLDDTLIEVMSRWGSNYQGRRVEAARQIIDDFHAQALQLLNDAQLHGLKSAEEPPLADEQIAAAKQVALKAGKVLSQANLADLQAAATALQAILDRAMPAAVGGEGEVVEADKGKGEGGDQEIAADGGSPGADSAPAEGEEQAMNDKAQKAALEALKALKAAKTEEERTIALAAIDTALKGTPDPKAEMQAAIKEAVEAAVKPLWDGLKAVAEKAIPGLVLPGDDNPTSSMTAPMDRPETPEQALRGIMDGPINLGSPLTGMAPAGGEGPFSVVGAQKGAPADPVTALKAQLGLVMAELLRLETSGAGRAIPAGQSGQALKGGLSEGDAAIDSLFG